MGTLKQKISVFSLNIWGLPFRLSKRKTERLTALAAALENLDYDILCLQEVWTKADYRIIKRQISHIYPYHHLYYSGVIGSGLCTFSKWPIIDTFFFRFSVNGYFHMIQHGDWLGGKGIGLSQIIINGFIVNVYNTHFHAQYDKKVDKYLPHRLIQAFDAASFINLTSNNANAVIVAGDLNSEPRDLCLRLIKNVTGLIDSYDFKKYSEELGTNECPNNSYTEKALLLSNCGIRIDYILFKSKDLKLEVESYIHPLEERVPGTDFSYSDHEAVGCTFALSSSDEKVSSDVKNDVNYIQTVSDAIDICNQALIDLKKTQNFYFILAVIIFISVFLISPFLTKHFLNIYFQMLIFCMYLLLFYFIVMATIWHNDESNSVKNSRKRMKLLINNVSKKL